MSKISLPYGGQTLHIQKNDTQVVIASDPQAPSSRGITPKNIAPSFLKGFNIVNRDNIPKSRGEASTPFFHLFNLSNEKGANQESLPMMATGDIYIIFHYSFKWKDCQKILQEYKLDIQDIRTPHKLVVSVPQGEDAVTIALQLIDKQEVQLAEPDFLTPIQKASFPLPSHAVNNPQWHLGDGQFQESFLNAGNQTRNPDMFQAGSGVFIRQAWEAMGNLGSSAITIAVLDDAFAIGHPAFANQNKIVDPKSFNDYQQHVLPVSADDKHGTSCAGVALANDMAAGILGACPNAKFMPIKTWGISDRLIEAYFEHAMQADVISCSWAVGKASYILSTRMKEAIHKAATQGRNGKGSIICFAAGNGGYSISHPDNPYAVMDFPTHPDVITVAASNSRGDRSDYSCFGNQIFITAPSNGRDNRQYPDDIEAGKGAGISTVGVAEISQYSRSYKIIHNFSGTSSACPLVAGICALILSVRPNLTANQVKHILKSTTDRIGTSADNYDINGHNRYFGYGKINALKAVKMAQEHAHIPSYIPIDGETPTLDSVDTTNTISAPPTPNTTTIYFDSTLKVTVELPNPEAGLYLKANAVPNIEAGDFDISDTNNSINKSVSLRQIAEGDYYFVIKGIKKPENT